MRLRKNAALASWWIVQLTLQSARPQVVLPCNQHPVAEGLCCPPATFSPFPSQPVPSHRRVFANAVQQQRKRWKVRGSEMQRSAPPPGGNRATDIVSGYTLLPRLCITQLQAEGDQEPPFAFRHRPSSSLERSHRGLLGALPAWTGLQCPQLPQGHRDFSGHGHMGTSHLITGPSATSSRIAVGFPACSAAESKQAAPGNDEPVRVSLADCQESMQKYPLSTITESCSGAITFSFCYFAYSGRPRDRSDSSSSTLMPV